MKRRDFLKHSALAATIISTSSYDVLATSRITSDLDPAHPLDALSKDEITAAVEVLKASGKIGESSRFPIIVLHEPPKEEVSNFKPGSVIRREAFAVVYERTSNETFEAIVDLKNKRVLSWRKIPQVQPPILIEDLILMTEIVRADPHWQAAIRKRGITDFQNVQIDPWSAGYYGFPDEERMRMVRAVSYYKGTATNGYARPIEGVIAYV